MARLACLLLLLIVGVGGIPRDHNVPDYRPEFHMRHTYIGNDAENVSSTLFFYRQLDCLAFSMRFEPKIKQLLSNCLASIPFKVLDLFFRSDRYFYMLFAHVKFD